MASPPIGRLTYEDVARLVAHGNAVSSIARLAGTSPTDVRRYLARHGLPQPRSEAYAGSGRIPDCPKRFDRN